MYTKGLLLAAALTACTPANASTPYQQMVDGWSVRNHITIFITERCVWYSDISNALRSVDAGARPRLSSTGRACVGDKVSMKYLYQDGLKRKSVSFKQYIAIEDRSH